MYTATNEYTRGYASIRRRIYCYHPYRTWGSNPGCIPIHAWDFDQLWRRARNWYHSYIPRAKPLLGQTRTELRPSKAVLPWPSGVPP